MPQVAWRSIVAKPFPRSWRPHWSWCERGRRLAALSALGLSTLLARESVAEPLSEGAIAGVVENGRRAIRRTCWEPALSARGDGRPRGARVELSFVVLPSGAVESVFASGSEQTFPGLSSCIGSAVAQWHFPPSSESKRVRVPFVFVMQDRP